jgi:hypothetical protein
MSKDNKDDTDQGQVKDSTEKTVEYKDAENNTGNDEESRPQATPPHQNAVVSPVTAQDDDTTRQAVPSEQDLLRTAVKFHSDVASYIRHNPKAQFLKDQLHPVQARVGLEIQKVVEPLTFATGGWITERDKDFRTFDRNASWHDIHQHELVQLKDIRAYRGTVTLNKNFVPGPLGNAFAGIHTGVMWGVMDGRAEFFMSTYCVPSYQIELVQYSIDV